MAEKKEKAETTVRRIRRKTRKKYSAEDKIRIVIEGLRGDMSVAELCRKEGISQSLYYKVEAVASNYENSSKLASSVWPGTPPARPTAVKSGKCVRKASR